MFCLLCEDALRAQDEPLIHVIINLRNLPFFRLNLLTELTRIRNTCETVEKNKLMNINEWHSTCKHYNVFSTESIPCKDPHSEAVYKDAELVLVESWSQEHWWRIQEAAVMYSWLLPVLWVLCSTSEHWRFSQWCSLYK